MISLNEYLQFIQEGPSAWRQRVEVFIKKDDKFIIGFNPRHNIYMPAGGGVEKNQDIYSAAENECLEELGIQIDNISLISKKPFIIRYDEYGNMDVISDKLRDRMKKFIGQHVYFLKGDFVKIDKRLYGRDNDILKPMVVTKQRAIELFKKNKHKITTHRVQAINKI